MADVLNHCAKYGYLQQVKELVGAGADVNKKSGEERGSALYFAACYGHVEICQFLLDNGADVNSAVKWGSTALHAVCDRGHGQVLNLLLSSKPDVNYQNKNGDTCLHVAAYRGYLELSRRLVGAGAEVRLRNRKGKTAQEEAEAKGHLQVAKYLAEVALKSPIKYRPRSDLRSSTPANRLKAFLPSYTRHHSHSIFRSAPESSMCTGNSLKTSDFTTTDWTVDSDTSLTSFPETFKSDSFVPNIPASAMFNSLPDEVPNGSMSNNSFYGPHSDSSYSENGFGDVYARRDGHADLLQKELEKEREKNTKLEKDVGMIPELRAMMQRMYQDNWALRKDVEHMQKQLTVVAQQRDEAQLALEAARGKQDVTERRRAVQEYMGDTNFGRSVSTVDADDFVICFEENNLNGDDKDGSAAAMLSKSGGHERQRDKCDTAEFRNNLMTSSLPVKFNGDNSKTSCMKTAVKTLDDIGGKACTDRGQSDSLRLKSTYKPDVCSDMRGVSSGRTVPKYEDASAIMATTHGQSKRLLESDFKPLVKRPSLPLSSSSSSSAVVYRALLNSFKDTTQEVLEKLGQSLMAQISAFQQVSPAFVVDRTGREWILGKDFVLDEQATGNIKKDRQTGMCSLSLGIWHNSHPFDLKIIFSASTDSSSSSSNIHLPALRHFPTEYDTLVQLVTHRNIMRICHYYHGTKSSLQQLLELVLSQDFHLSTQGSNQTFCVVTERYPYTLQTLADKMLSDVAKRSHKDCETHYNGSMQDFIVIPPPSSSATSSGQTVTPPIVKESNCMPEDLLLLILYQLLSAVNHMLLHGVVHRDIKPESIFLDQQLRVVLGNFGLARRLLTQDGQDIMYVTSDQVTAGNPLAWAPELTRFRQDGVKCTSKEVTLKNVYNYVDCFSVGRMFYSLLLPQDNFPSPSPTKPHYRDDEIPGLPSCYSAGVRDTLFRLVLDNPEDRLTCPVAMARIGVMLFGPARDEVNSVKDCAIWRHARMMSLIRHAKSNKTGLSSDSFTVQECIESVSPEVERHFVLESKGEDIWDAYRWLVSVDDAP